MNARYFERYFPRDVDVEQMDLSMCGYEFSWARIWIWEFDLEYKRAKPTLWRVYRRRIVDVAIGGVFLRNRAYEGVMDVLQTDRRMQTTQDPNAFCFGSFGEHLHAFALATLNPVFLTLSEPDSLGMSRKMYVPIRRVEAFL
jgi:hypothetical protein